MKMKRKLKHMIMHDTVQLLFNLKIGHIKREENLREIQEFCPYRSMKRSIAQNSRWVSDKFSTGYAEFRMKK